MTTSDPIGRDLAGSAILKVAVQAGILLDHRADAYPPQARAEFSLEEKKARPIGAKNTQIRVFEGKKLRRNL